MQRAQKLFLNHTTYQLDQIVTFEKVNLGLSNSTYYVKTIDDKEFQVRITENNDIISRTCEYAVIQALSVPYLYYDLENGNSIRTWIHGKNPTNLEIDHTFLDQLVLAIKKIHQTDLCLLNNQVPMHNNKCFYEIPGVQQIDAKFLELYSTLTTKHQDLPKNLSHNDISLLNVIWNVDAKSLNVIDFEWSRINNDYWDYANFLREAKIDPHYWAYVAQVGQLDYQTLLDHLFLTTCFALQWTYCMPVSPAILSYRAEVLEWTQYYYDLISPNLNQIQL